MHPPSHYLRLFGLSAVLAVTVIALTVTLEHFGSKSVSNRVQLSHVATPAASPIATASPLPSPIVVGTVNVNIHSTPEDISTNFVVTAWKDHPMTVLDAHDATWLHVRYLTTDNQTVEGYVLRSLTTQAS